MYILYLSNMLLYKSANKIDSSLLQWNCFYHLIQFNGAMTLGCMLYPWRHDMNWFVLTLGQVKFLCISYIVEYNLWDVSHRHGSLPLCWMASGLPWSQVFVPVWNRQAQTCSSSRTIGPRDDPVVGHSPGYEYGEPTCWNIIWQAICLN